MGKKIRVLFLLSILCLNLTACSGEMALRAIPFVGPVFADIWGKASDIVEEAEADRENQEQLNLVQNISANNRSQSTEDALQDFVSAKAAYSAAKNSWYSWLPFVGANAALAKVTIAHEKLETTAATDSVYQDSLRNGVGDVNSIWSKLKAEGLVYFAIIGVIVLILLFLVNLRNKRKLAKINRKANIAQAKANLRIAKAEARAIESEHVGVSESVYHKVAITEESYKRMIAENCRKAGLSPEQLLLECNGNLEQAYQRSNIAVAMKNS